MSDQLPAPVTEPTPTSEPTAQQLLIELPAVQQIALQELGKGSTITDAARAAGVHRLTVSRWIHEDPDFAAAHNAWCQELLDSGFCRALAMTDPALTTLAKAIQNGHVNASLQLIKHVSVLRAARVGPTDAGQIKRRRAVAKARKEKKLRDAEVRAGLRLEEKLEQDGITWTRKAEILLHPEELSLLKVLREKAAGRTWTMCHKFAPSDNGRKLSSWEYETLLKARAEVLSDGWHEFHGGIPDKSRQKRDGKEQFERLVQQGMPESDARRIIELSGLPGLPAADPAAAADTPPVETKAEQTAS